MLCAVFESLLLFLTFSWSPNIQFLFFFLSPALNKHGRIETEIKRVKLNSVWWDKQITRNTKIMIHRSIVESILIYGEEAWTKNVAIK